MCLSVLDVLLYSPLIPLAFGFFSQVVGKDFVLSTHLYLYLKSSFRMSGVSVLLQGGLLMSQKAYSDSQISYSSRRVFGDDKFLTKKCVKLYIIY